MSRKLGKPDYYILTANDLLTGDIVYWSSGNDWARHFYEAQVGHEPNSETTLMELGKHEESRNTVVGAYVIGVEKTPSNGFQPLALRERRRLFGPGVLGQASIQIAA